MTVSEKTIQRRVNKYELHDEFPKYTGISDLELGIRRMKGHLQVKNGNVTWGRVRSSLWRVDPVGILSRTIQATLIFRRKYFVPGSLALWLVNGNNKLIRFGFVIHGAIDGFSLKIIS